MTQLGDIGTDTDLQTNSPIPVGTMLPFAGQSAPTGWNLCNGAEILRSSPLGTFLGSTYGSGNGTSTYNLPDMRDKFPMGKNTGGTAATLGERGGAINHSHAGGSYSNQSHDHQNSSLVMPAHSHGDTIALSAHSHSVPLASANCTASGSFSSTVVQGANTFSASPGVAGGVSNSASASVSGRTAGSGTLTATGTSGSGDIPYQVVNYIIKA